MTLFPEGGAFLWWNELYGSFDMDGFITLSRVLSFITRYLNDYLVNLFELIGKRFTVARIR
ncbi:hypothetical protein ECB94_27565 (plasmid) [Vibrio mediterranei]|uniref:Uncharacterized protein n=1 Tax=Vibrio mediterranei TaxID=689 RepID=A0A3G4VN61_9VIBR|nr:hypothetical protein ECB94_27565 [Vibrio mediterranei]